MGISLEWKPPSGLSDDEKIQLMLDVATNVRAEPGTAAWLQQYATARSTVAPQ